MFQDQVTYAARGMPDSVAMADFDGDGHLDVIVGNGGTNRVGVFLNKGDGTLAPQIEYGDGSPAPPYPLAVAPLATADFDGDGHPDVVAILPNPLYFVEVFLNDGRGHFRYPDARRSRDSLRHQRGRHGRFRGRGRMDFALAQKSPAGSASAGVFLNAGDATFPAVPPYSTSDAPYDVPIQGGLADVHGIAIGDLDGDGHADIVVGNGLLDEVGVFLNKGDGAFGSEVAYGTGHGSSPGAVALADLNGDGRPDVVAVAGGTGQVTVFLNRGHGVLGDPGVYGGTSPSAVALGDVDGDGHPDIVVTNSLAFTVGVYLNKGDGTFQAQATFDTGTGSYPDSVAMGDSRRRPTNGPRGRQRGHGQRRGAARPIAPVQQAAPSPPTMAPWRRSWSSCSRIASGMLHWRCGGEKDIGERAGHAARRTYRWCRPPALGSATTFPSSLGSTARVTGASPSSPMCGRSSL